MSPKIDTLSPLGTVEPLGTGAALRMAARGMIWLDIEGHASTPLLDRWDRTEVAERHLGDWRGPKGAAFVAAVRAGDVRAQRRATREIGA